MLLSTSLVRSAPAGASDFLQAIGSECLPAKAEEYPPMYEEESNRDAGRGKGRRVPPPVSRRGVCVSEDEVERVDSGWAISLRLTGLDSLSLRRGRDGCLDCVRLEGRQVRQRSYPLKEPAPSDGQSSFDRLKKNLQWPRTVAEQSL